MLVVLSAEQLAANLVELMDIYPVDVSVVLMVIYLVA